MKKILFLLCLSIGLANASQSQQRQGPQGTIYGDAEYIVNKKSSEVLPGIVVYYPEDLIVVKWETNINQKICSKRMTYRYSNAGASYCPMNFQTSQQAQCQQTQQSSPHTMPIISEQVYCEETLSKVVEKFLLNEVFKGEEKLHIDLIKLNYDLKL